MVVHEETHGEPSAEAVPPPIATEDASGEMARFHRRLDLLTDQVDALQVAAAQANRPWWREPSLIISAVALIISALFSVIGMRQVSAKDLAAKQESLRQTMVQIVDSQAEMTEAAQQYSGDPLMARWANSTLNSKRQVQMDTALALVAELGNKVDASSLLPLAGQLQLDGRYDESLALYFKALDLVRSPIVKSAILRSIGWSYRIAGSNAYDLDKSREYLQRAVDLFANQEDDAGRFYLADVLLFWAELEKADGNAERAAALFDQAKGAAEGMAVTNSSRATILAQIEQSRGFDAAGLQAAPDLRGDWQLAYPGSSSRKGTARLTFVQSSGTYYVTMLVLREGVVYGNRAGTGTLPDAGTLLIQWQGTRFSDQFQVAIQDSGTTELAISPDGRALTGTDSAVGELQEPIVLSRAKP